MPSTYTLNNGIELIGTGEQSGTWGDTTNTNLSLLDTALDGQVTVTLATAGTSGSPNALPISDGSASDGRNRMIIFADSGDLGATAYVQLTPNDAEKIIYIRNDLSGSRSILFFQGTYNASNDYEVPAGTTAVVYFDGAGAGAVAANVFNNAYFDSLRLGSVSVTAILDEDNMASDSATALATQQSIKAYVDTQVGANNELSEVLANGNTSGGNAIQMTTTDELQFRDTALKISSSADGQLDIDADTEIEIVAPTVDIDASTAMTIDTAALTVTGAVDFNTSLNVDGTVTSDGLTVAGNVSVDGGTIKLDGNYPVGTENVALGNTALDSVASDGNYNVAVGSEALTGNTSGDNNVGLGRRALFNNTTASSSVAIGTQALNTSTTGTENVSVGHQSSLSNVTGSGNTMAGYQAGYLVGDEIVATAIVSGVNYTIQTLGTTDFTLIGAGANTVGTTFTATGAGTGTGTASANANYNTFVGYQAGDLIVGGSKNSILGSFDGNQNTIDIRNSNNNIVLSDGDGNPRLAYVSANTELVINEQSADVDFRVESNNNTHALFVDAGNSRVGVNNSSPSFPLDVTGNARIQSSLTLGSNPSNPGSLVLNDDSTTAYTLTVKGTGTREYTFEGSSSGGAYNLYFNNADVASGMNVNFYGNATFNQNGNDFDFRVESDSNTHMLFVDASANKVGINTSSPDAFLDIESGNNEQFKLSGTDTNPTTMMIDYNSTGSTDRVRIQNNAGDLRFLTSNGNVRMNVTKGGTVRIGDTSGTSTDAGLDLYYNHNLYFTNTAQSVMRFNGDAATNFTTGASNFRAGQYIFNVGGGYHSIEMSTNTGQNGDAISGWKSLYKGDNSANVFNEDSYDIDFRVESDSNSNMLFVDAGNDQVVVGTSTPITGVGAAMTIGGLSDTRLAIDGSTSSGLYLTDSGAQGITIRNASGDLEFYGITTREFVFNAGSIDTDFRVESDNNANMFFVDASGDQIGIGTNSFTTYTQTTAVGNTKAEYNATQWASFSGAQDGSGMFAQNLFRWHDGVTTRTSYTNTHGSIGGAGVLVGAGWNTGKLVATNVAATAGAEATNLKTQLTWQTDVLIVNDDGDANIDFRVESDGNANMLVVDAAQNVVGIRDADTTLNGSLVSRGEGTYSSGNIAGLFYANSGNRGTIRIRSLDNDSAECAFDVNGALRWMISTRPSNDAQGAYCMKWYPASGTPGYGIVGGNVMTLTQSGDLTINGALSKGSGSFRIKHPLPEKNATHDLVHSFVEAPQADNIYRGKVALVAGQASVNIDTVAGMTEGTFAALNREVQCFTSNETGWTAVRGSVSGNILAIEAQDNTCTDTISWMVIGERQDEHMYDTNWTDENGKVIVEPLRPAGSDDPS